MLEWFIGEIMVYVEKKYYLSKYKEIRLGL